MDLRVKKTKRNIINAFLNLRSRKPLEKITVKELAEKANINKATFYLHYHDIYELSEYLEKQVIELSLQSIEHPDTLFQNNKLFIKELTMSISANEQLIRILFEGNRNSRFIELFENGLTELIKKNYPEYQPDTERKMIMTYLICGGYYTYFKYYDYGIEPILQIIEKCSEAIIKPYQ